MSDSTTTPPASTTLRPRLELVVLDCPDPKALAAFYAEILGWGIEPDDDESWATLEPPGGALGSDNLTGSITLAFQGVENYQAPTWPEGPRPQHSHLDFMVPDIDAAEPAVLAAGATLHEHQPS